MGCGRSTTAEYAPVSQPVGIYGWRKRCLYAFILFLMVVMIMNLALTIWILRVMNFSIDGMGQLKITPSGVKVEGEAEFVKSVYVEDIKSKDNQPLFVEAARDVHLQARDENNKQTASFSLEKNKATVMCDTFEVKDNNGISRFLVNKDEIIFGADEVVYSGKATFDGSVETPSLRGPQSESLVVESESSAVKLSAPGGVFLQAPAGNIDINTADDIRLHSKYGSILLDSANIFLKRLKLSSPTGSGREYPGVHQLCMCPSGRIFLAAPSGDCRATGDICNSKR
ncbi:zeta-sarcoglycan-like [Haliotis cracherodii]|uniref:zeta-sarcoglycan-like n=1 Tax=Haliotis cracherodii TaxID=6455 RepID=UPI0039EB4BFC